MTYLQTTDNRKGAPESSVLSLLISGDARVSLERLHPTFGSIKGRSRVGHAACATTSRMPFLFPRAEQLPAEAAHIDLCPCHLRTGVCSHSLVEG